MEGLFVEILFARSEENSIVWYRNTSDIQSVRGWTQNNKNELPQSQQKDIQTVGGVKEKKTSRSSRRKTRAKIKNKNCQFL